MWTVCFHKDATANAFISSKSVFTSKSTAGVRLSLFSQLSISTFCRADQIPLEAIRLIRPSSVTRLMNPASSKAVLIFEETLCPTLELNAQSSLSLLSFPVRQTIVFSSLCFTAQGRKLRRFHASDPSCLTAITPAHLPFVASGVQLPRCAVGNADKRHSSLCESQNTVVNYTVKAQPRWLRIASVWQEYAYHFLVASRIR